MEEYDADVIDLKTILHILKKRKWFLIFMPLAAMIISALISFFVLTPIYQASTTMIVAKNHGGENAALLQYNDLLTANQLVNTYSQIAKSRAVTQQVLTAANLNINPEEFSKKIEVTPVKETQLIKVTVKDADPQRAAKLANLVSAVFMIKVQEILKVDNVQVVDSAIPLTEPIQPNKQLNIAIAGVLGLMLAVGIIFLMEFLNQNIKNSDDINRHLELPVLGTIPKM